MSLQTAGIIIVFVVMALIVGAVIRKLLNKNDEGPKGGSGGRRGPYSGGGRPGKMR